MTTDAAVVRTPMAEILRWAWAPIVAIIGWVGLHLATGTAKSLELQGIHTPPGLCSIGQIFAGIALSGTLLACIGLGMLVVERLTHQMPKPRATIVASLVFVGIIVLFSGISMGMIAWLHRVVA